MHICAVWSEPLLSAGRYKEARFSNEEYSYHTEKMHMLISIWTGQTAWKADLLAKQLSYSLMRMEVDTTISCHLIKTVNPLFNNLQCKDKTDYNDKLNGRNF